MQENGTEHRRLQKHVEIFEMQKQDTVESLYAMYLIHQNDDDDADIMMTLLWSFIQVQFSV